MRRFLCLILVLFLMIPPVSAAERPKYAAVTFDDGPSGRFTRALLEGLEERHVKATFFLCGYRLESYGELATEIRAGGHEIGLHGYSHDSMANMTQEQITRELQETSALLPAPYCVNLLRAPGGKLSDAVRRAAEEAGLAIMSWSVDPRDWNTNSVSQITHCVVTQTGDGDVILMHDLSDSSVEAALAFIDELTAQGYQFLTVSQLALLRLVHLNSGESYSCFHP